MPLCPCLTSHTLLRDTGRLTPVTLDITVYSNTWEYLWVCYKEHFWEKTQENRPVEETLLRWRWWNPCVPWQKHRIASGAFPRIAKWSGQWAQGLVEQNSTFTLDPHQVISAACSLQSVLNKQPGGLMILGIPRRPCSEQWTFKIPKIKNRIMVCGSVIMDACNHVFFCICVIIPF